MYDSMKEKFLEERDREKYFIHFQTIKIFQSIQTFSHDSNVLKLFIHFNKPPFFLLWLPSFTFVYLC